MRMTDVVVAGGRRVVGACLVALVASGVCAGAVQAAGVTGQGTWETTLQGRDLDGNAANGFEAYYDTALDLTWLADANYAKTSGYDADGRMNWNAANAWAANLNVNGITGWRLPTMVDTGLAGCPGGWRYTGIDCGYNVSTSTSEMAHLFYVTLGDKAYFDSVGNGPQSGWGLTNTGLFQNVNTGVYWTDLAAAPRSFSWGFFAGMGYQGLFHKDDEFSAWAVHPGDVGIAAVPEPASYALALAGLTVAGLARRRRAA